MDGGKYYLIHKWWTNSRRSQSIIPVRYENGVAIALRGQDQPVVDYILNSSGSVQGIAGRDGQRRAVLLPMRDTVKPNVYWNASGILERVVAVGEGQRSMTPMQPAQVNTSGVALKQRGAFPPMKTSNPPPPPPVQYPMGALTARTTVLSDGTYYTDSALHDDAQTLIQFQSFKAFDRLTGATNMYQGATSTTPSGTPISMYNTSPPYTLMQANYTQSQFPDLYFTAYSPQASSNVPLVGDWVSVAMPANVRVSTLTFTPRQDDLSLASTRSPQAFNLVGSSDGTSWTLVYSTSGQAWSSVAPRVFNVSATAAYPIYRFQVPALSGAGGQLNFHELSFSGVSTGSAPALPTPTTSAMTISSVTTSGATVDVSGNYTAYRLTWNNGASTSGFRKSSPYAVAGLLPNTAYTFNAIPYNVMYAPNTSGTLSRTIVTLPTLRWDASGYAAATVVPLQAYLPWLGAYSYVIVTWNSSGVAQTSGQQTGTSYTATGLPGGANITFTLTPYNTSGVAGTAITQAITISGGLQPPKGSNAAWTNNQYVQSFNLFGTPKTVNVPSYFTGQSLTYTAVNVSGIAYSIDSSGNILVDRYSSTQDPVTFVNKIRLTATNTAGSFSIEIRSFEQYVPTGVDENTRYSQELPSTVYTITVTQDPYSYDITVNSSRSAPDFVQNDPMSLQYQGVFSSDINGVTAYWSGTVYDAVNGFYTVNLRYNNTNNRMYISDYYNNYNELTIMPFLGSNQTVNMLNVVAIGGTGNPGVQQVQLVPDATIGGGYYYDVVSGGYPTFQLPYDSGASSTYNKPVWTLYPQNVKLALNMNTYRVGVQLEYVEATYDVTNTAIVDVDIPAYSLEGNWVTVGSGFDSLGVSNFDRLSVAITGAGTNYPPTSWNYTFQSPDFTRTFLLNYQSSPGSWEIVETTGGTNTSLGHIWYDVDNAFIYDYDLNANVGFQRILVGDRTAVDPSGVVFERPSFKSALVQTVTDTTVSLAIDCTYSYYYIECPSLGGLFRIGYPTDITQLVEGLDPDTDYTFTITPYDQTIASSTALTNLAKVLNVHTNPIV